MAPLANWTHRDLDCKAQLDQIGQSGQCLTPFCPFVQIQIVLGFYDEHIANLPDDMQKMASIDANKWPTYCYKREGLEVDKRLLKKEYAEVRELRRDVDSSTVDRMLSS